MLRDRVATDLLRWYEASRRDLPWRRTSDPYAIWISEVMLQQTRVAAVIPYFSRFLARFPNVEALAAASEPELLSAWAGLGYYRRARNLKKAAEQVGPTGLPASYEGLLALPGFGAYTAAAVASIAWGLPHAAVDGNVVRVISRLRGANLSRNDVQHEADTLLDKHRAGDFNQAMMELGATVCLPRAPRCLLCPLAGSCRARAEGTQNELPSRARKPETIDVTRTVVVATCGDFLLLHLLTADAPRMSGFWEVPDEALVNGPGELAGSFRHSITNHRYRIGVRRVEWKRKRKVESCVWFRLDEVPALPLTTISRKALRICSVRSL